MAIIHIYDATTEDQESIQSELGQHGDIRFTNESISLENIDHEAEIISVFVASKVSGEVIEKLPSLRLIACRSTGFNNIDLEACKERNIAVLNVPSYGENTVAEYTFGLLLSLTRRIINASEAFKRGGAGHGDLRGIDLHGKTLGLVGSGRIGRNVAAIAKGFGLNIKAYDLYPNNEWAERSGVEYVALDDLLKNSDFITLHVPYSKDVHHMIDRAKLELVKPTAILINTARGELVDTSALLESLVNGKLGGAAIDVFEGESLVDVHNELLALRDDNHDLLEHALEQDALGKLPNVIVTNHNAFNTVEAIGRINKTTAENIIKFLNGETQNSVI